MRLLKPGWVCHDGHSIFSLDIHPDGSRFATGGQGDDCGRIVIWNMAPVLNEEDEQDENIPKMLCQMDNHLACVNCVRWSNGGRYLASAGDDKVIMIWQTGRYSGSSAVFGGSGSKVNVEQWRCVSTLRGHSGDILDLAWSPCDVWLASCSVDNSVIVWNAQKMPEMLCTLKGHTGLVKGVAWDPVGKYLASQSDDKSLRVWRTSDWHLETNVTEPFNECGGTTHVLRLSWSPDGQYLVSAHAMNNSGPTAQIIDRDGWRIEKDFVGHRKAITCVRFNPNILSKTSKVPGKVHHYCCCAIGSRDRSLSIWLTALKRPLVVIHDLFSNSILDVSWNCRGDQLMACSGDGTVVHLSFEKDEIGKSLSDDEKNAFYQKMYGKSVSIGNNLNSANTIIENPEMLKLKKYNEQEQQVQLQRQQENSKTTSQVKGPVNCQIETRTADGRRRITPMFIAPAPDLGDAPQPFNSRAHPTFSSSTERQSRIMIEKRDESTRCNSVASNNSNQDIMSEVVILQSSPGEPGISVTIPNPAVNGISTSIIEIPKLPEISTTVSTIPTISAADKIKVTQTEMSTGKDVSKPNAKPMESRKDIMSKLSKRGPGRPPLSEKLAHQHAMQEREAAVAAAAAAAVARTTSSHVGQDLRLPVLKAEKSHVIQVNVGKSEPPVQLELENGIQATSKVQVHKLRCLKNSRQTWDALLSARGCAVAASRFVVCVVCEDGSLSIFSQTGRRLFPPLVLSSSASRLVCNGHYVMAITSRGFVSVWDVKSRSVLIRNESLLPIMTGLSSDLSINGTILTDKGCPVVTLSTGKSFTFDVDMGCWMLIHDSENVVQQCSDHHSCLPSQTIVRGSNSLPLAVVQSQTRKLTAQARRLFHLNPTLQQASTLSHIDSQLTASLSLRSAKEFKFWLLTLTRYLVQEELETRLREMCDLLVCSPSARRLTDDVSETELHILGMHKSDLLEEVLPIIGSKLQLQRLYTEYQEQLELAKA